MGSTAKFLNKEGKEQMRKKFTVVIRKKMFNPQVSNVDQVYW